MKLRNNESQWSNLDQFLLYRWKLSGGIRVKIQEVVDSALGPKSADGGIKSAVPRRISRYNAKPATKTRIGQN